LNFNDKFIDKSINSVLYNLKLSLKNNFSGLRQCGRPKRRQFRGSGRRGAHPRPGVPRAPGGAADPWSEHHPWSGHVQLPDWSTDSPIGAAGQQPAGRLAGASTAAGFHEKPGQGHFQVYNTNNMVLLFCFHETLILKVNKL